MASREYDFEAAETIINGNKELLTEYKKMKETYEKSLSDLEDKLADTEYGIESFSESLSSLEKEIDAKKQEQSTEMKNTKIIEGTKYMWKSEKEKDLKISSQAIMILQKEVDNLEGQKNVVAEGKSEKEKDACVIRKQIAEIKEEINQIEPDIREKEKIISQKEEERKKEEELERTKLTEPFRFLSGSQGDVSYQKVKEELLEKLSQCRDKQTEVEFINILLVGATGTGKSSFIKACATALKNEGRPIHTTTIRNQGAKSATIKLIPIDLEEEDGTPLKIRIFDCRGICDTSSCGTEEMAMVINGNISPYSELQPAHKMKSPGIYVEDPLLDNEMHCVVFVAKATGDSKYLLSEDARKVINGLSDIVTPINKPQIVLLTFMDMVVPNNDILNMFSYPYVQKKCKAIAAITQLPTYDVLPMANYTSEPKPTDFKDSLALYNLWRMASYGCDYIKERAKENKFLSK